MTVEQLIEMLNAVEDKTILIAFNDDGYGLQYPQSISVQTTSHNKGYYGGVPKDCVVLD